MTSSPAYTSSPNVASCELADGLALLNLSSGVYFSMNAVAALVWENLQTSQTSTQLAAIVEIAFDVSHAQALADIEVLLENMLELNLIEQTDAPSH